MKSLHRSMPLRAAAACAAAIACSPPALAQSYPSNQSTVIYTCTTAEGRHITSDRLIRECIGLEQRVLNRDGTVRMVLTPPLSPEQSAIKEAQERRAAAERLARQEAVRRDRNLLARYPDDASHLRAREASLDTLRAAMKASEERLRELATERKALNDEVEFYRGKALPPKLQQQVDANDAAVEAQRALVDTQRAEMERINKFYDAEAERLRKLRAGAAPGSLGPLVTSAARSNLS
jgi:hypothetical protein